MLPGVTDKKVLLQGEAFSGKTALMAHTAVTSGFPFIRKIAADELIGMGEVGARASCCVRMAAAHGMRREGGERRSVSFLSFCFFPPLFVVGTFASCAARLCAELSPRERERERRS